VTAQAYDRMTLLESKLCLVPDMLVADLVYFWDKMYMYIYDRGM